MLRTANRYTFNAIFDRDMLDPAERLLAPTLPRAADRNPIVTSLLTRTDHVTLTEAPSTLEARNCR